MLADDDAHIENVKIILLSLLPLAPAALLILCRLGLLLSSDDSKPSRKVAVDQGGSIDNNLEQPLVLGVAPKSPSGGADSSPKFFGDVSHLEQTPLSVWRQSAAAGLLLISVGSFVGLEVGCYLFKDGSKIVPRNETMGMAAVAISAFIAVQFYRREVKKPARVIVARTESGKGRVFRARAMLGYWLCVLGVQVYRIYTTIQIYRADWDFMNKAFCVLLLIADIACALVALPSIALFLRAERLREDIRGLLYSVYGGDCFDHIMPSTTKDPSPEPEVGLLKLLTFTWIQKVLRKGRKELLTHDDLYAMKEDDRASIVFARLQKVWRDKSAGMSTETSYSLYAVIWSFLNPTFLFATALKLLNDSLAMLDVLLLNLMVKHMTSDEPRSTGFVLCGLLALNAYSETFFLNQYFHRMFVCGVRLRSCLATAVYLKALRVDQSQLSAETAPVKGESEFTSGKIINLMSTDAQRVGDVMSFIQILWSAPFQIAICSVMLYKQLGLASLGGIAVMVLGIPLTAVLTAKTRKLQKTMMELKDERLKCTSELIQGIRAIKIYSWELPFMRLIDGIRLKELDALKYSQITNSYSRFMINAIPIAVALVSFTIFIAVQKDELTPAIAFTSLALFESLRFPLFSLPNVIMAASEASVTVRRLQLFMNLPELKTAHLTDPTRPATEPLPIDPADKIAISCNGLDIGFGGASPDDELSSAPSGGQEPHQTSLLMADLNMRLRLGEYIAVVGRTGCGKSVLFNTILRELDSIVAGEMTLRGTVALCTQSAWIRSGSVRDNILFGKPFVESWYQRVVDACALRPDFKVLTDGDFTEIGERGVNLSGGQKQRIALARAVYFDAEVYILDDILSAVDSHVATHIYQHVIRGLLREKAVLLATHRFECLDGADHIYMLRRGRAPVVFDSIAAARRNAEFSALADEGVQQQEEEKAAAEDGTPPASAARRSDSMLGGASTPAARSSSRVPRPSASMSGSLEMSQCLSKEIDPDFTEQQPLVELEGEEENEQQHHGESKALVAQEAMQEGGVSGKVYLSYVRAGGGWGIILLLIVLLCSTAAAGLGANFWLSHWSDHAASIDSVHGLLWYGAIQIGGLVLLILALAMLIVVTQKAARFYHGRMLSRIIHASMRFFEATPIGRLTNKFSKDLYTIDELLPMTLYQFLNMLVQVLSTLVAVSVILPIMLVVIAPVLVVYYWTERLYVAVARQFKRLDSVSRSPLFTHFSESLDGARTIRAMRQKGQFLGLHLKYLDENMSAAYIYIVSNRWLSVRLECLGNLIVSAVAIFCVVLRSQLSGGNAGLALSYSIRVTGYLNWLVRMSGDRESNIVAVERVIEYNDDENCPQEDYLRRMALPEEKAAPTRKSSKHRSPSFGEDPAPADLPLMPLGTVGEVELVNVALRYRPELPFALKNVSFKIARGEKVGIVGRTGAGKSSLLVCLLRLVELTEGSILVHGVDSLTYSVDQLREQISIIPQDSVIFSGTLRRNLDPFERASEDELWAALAKACLKDFVESLPGGLDHPITENGGNISVGQRQLLCLARVLLKRASVLLLDEATSAVDPQTDAQIQKCLREEFNQTTIITIAHRLKTVIDYDRIIVMANGGILEQGPPAHLLADPQSEFSQMYLSM